jgi:hypothetical protein
MRITIFKESQMEGRVGVGGTDCNALSSEAEM